jgi:NAD(P)-dependent dehydrogenase (short-subunit alcohol dehydrogenase family)
MKQRAGRVEGKVAVVTGAGQTRGEGYGTGRAISMQLAREGAKVVLVDLNVESAEETKSIIESEGGEAFVVKANCTKWRDCADMAMAAVDKFGTIDILVNNLGLAVMGAATEMLERDWDRTFDINLRSVFLCSKFIIPIMAAQKKGSIINLSSMSAQRAGRTLAYSAAKAGVEAVTFDMAHAHGGQGVRVNCVMPGNINTPIATAITLSLPEGEMLYRLRQSLSMLGTPGDAWDIAHAVVFFASDDARWVTGQTLNVDAGATRLGAMSKFAEIRDILDEYEAKKGN